jgi:hypothetical protein
MTDKKGSLPDLQPRVRHEGSRPSRLRRLCGSPVGIARWAESVKPKNPLRVLRAKELWSFGVPAGGAIGVTLYAKHHTPGEFVSVGFVCTLVYWIIVTTIIRYVLIGMMLDGRPRE